MNENEINESGFTENAEKSPETKKNTLNAVFDWIEILTVSLSVVIFIFMFVARVTTVSGNSMYPTLHSGERLLISNIGYTPKNGDVIVLQEEDGIFEYPLVKRVIATGGQKVEIDFENWEVRVEGKLLDEDYINFEFNTAMKSYGCEEEFTVPEGHLFVMGDNRNGSTDSRDARVGFVSEDAVLGRVICRIAPLQRMGAVE